MRRVTVGRKRLVLLAVLGVLMTLSVAGAALVSMAQVHAVNRELAQVNEGLHHHQNADHMHDALHADVARAQLAGSRRPGFSVAEVRRQAARHATRYRRDLQAVASLRLPPRLRTALSELRPAQETYIATAEMMVGSALSGRGSSLIAQTSYDAAFQQLVPAQASVTRLLVATSTQVEREATEQRNEAERVVGLSTVAALAGWLGLVAWHRRSIGNLQAALVREAEQRATADLLQRSLLPAGLPAVEGARLCARSIPSSAKHHVGGDWYDVVDLPTGEVCLVIGDVVGHDLTAASVMGQLRNALRAYVLEDSSPASVLSRLNRTAYLLDISDLATCVCAVVDPATMRVRWANAGHLPPLVSSADGTGRLLHGEPGPPVGVVPAADYELRELQLEPDDALLLYSDGLVERRGTHIDAALQALTAVPLPRVGPDAMCDRLLETLVHNRPDLDDDVTLLMLQVGGSRPTPTAPEPAAWRARR